MGEAKSMTSLAREVIAGATNISVAHINDDAGIGTLAAWDSMAHVNIMLALEARLQTVLKAEQIISITSLKSIAKLLGTHMDHISDGK